MSQDKSPSKSLSEKQDAGGDGSFFARWSRRKTQARSGEGAGDAATAVAAPAGAAAMGTASATATGTASATANATVSATATAAATASATHGTSAAPAAPSAPASVAPQPTLEDVEQLNSTSDYRAFVARDVDPQVRNAAFKKLFHSDPHFNVMDGLDVYIDDYNTPNPLPLAVMKTLVQARAMGLIDDELKEQELPPPDPQTPVTDPAEAAKVDAADAGGAPGDVEAEAPASTEASTMPTPVPGASMASGTLANPAGADGGEAAPSRGAEVVHVLHVEAIAGAADLELLQPANGDHGWPTATVAPIATPVPTPAPSSTVTATPVPDTAAQTTDNVVPFPRRP